MKTLKEILQEPRVYPRIVEDCLNVLDDEVSKKSGLSGMAIKGAYKVLKGLQNGRILRKAVEALLPEFVEKLEPHYLKYSQEKDPGSWEVFLRPRYETIAYELLEVTDAKVKRTQERALRSAYEKLRPRAHREVVASLPALARMMERHLPTR